MDPTVSWKITQEIINRETEVSMVLGSKPVKLINGKTLHQLPVITTTHLKQMAMKCVSLLQMIIQVQIDYFFKLVVTTITDSQVKCRMDL